MNRTLLLGLCGLAWAGLAGAAAAEEAPPAARPAPAPEAAAPVREIRVPFEDLDLLLESGPHHVLLSREEYRKLEQEARKSDAARPPVPALLTAAAYTMEIEQDRALITGTLGVDGLSDGLHALPLEFNGIGLQAAQWGDVPAALGRADGGGPLTLFFRGRGARTLNLRAVTALQTTAARQILSFRLPAPPAAKLTVVAPGDVEIHSGAALVSRVYDEAAQKTRLELLLPAGDTTLVMSLNSRLKRMDRVVMARSVLVDEVTSAYERLHATISLDVLHRAVKDFRFVVPRGFDLTDVHSPNLARWEVTAGPDGDWLDVHLREEATGTVVLNLVAARARPPLGDWEFPRFEPVDTVGHVAVAGLLLEERLTVRTLAAKNLVPVDRAVLMKALPRTVLQAEAGQAVIRPMVAYYAAQPAFELKAAFDRPAARLQVTTNTLLLLQDGGLEVQGGFLLTPYEEKLFQFDFLAPAGWQVTAVTGPDGGPLAFERYEAADRASRIHIRLPAGVAPGQETRVLFQANHIPSRWLDEWTRIEADFPVFAVVGADRDIGAVAAEARDDLNVTPAALTRLTPLDANEKSKYGLGGSAESLAFRYESQPYAARLLVQRRAPRLTADTFSFFRVERDALAAHYEILYQVEDARTRQVALDLPLATPAALAIRGLGGAEVKEFSSVETNGVRRWTARLAEARRGRIHLAVDFQMPVSEAAMTNFFLPVIRAADVAYQSGLLAVEGHAELDVVLPEHPRKVDIGELAEAEYQPGRRLLGAYGFVGEPPATRMHVKQRPSCPLPPALVQRAEVATVFSAQGTCQSIARFSLRNKTAFVEIQLPGDSTLWSVSVDDRPARPQKERDRVIVALPAGRVTSDVRVVYETPVDSLRLWSRLQVPAPRLALREQAEGGAREEVPVADLHWNVYTPSGYRVAAAGGTVAAPGLHAPQPAAVHAAKWLYEVLGGVGFRRGLLSGCVHLLGSASMHSRGRLMAQLEKSGGYPADAKMEVGADDTDHWTARDQAAPSAAPTPPVVQTPSPAIPVEPPAPAPSRPETKGGKAKGAWATWAVEGARSLKIDLVQSGRRTEFQSLGADPKLDLHLVSERRMDSLAWALALAAFLGGLTLTGAPAHRKMGYLLLVLVASTALPAIPGLAPVAFLLNGVFYAACWLIPCYLLAGPLMRLGRWLGRGFLRLAGAVVPALLLLAGPATAEAQGVPAADRDTKYVVEMMPEQPVVLPTNAVVAPYTPGGAVDSRLLVPWEVYQELWRKSHPAEDPAVKYPSPAHAVAGSSFSATLTDQDTLTFQGQLMIEVFSEAPVLVPLHLEAAVLSKATLDGAPARLGSAPGPAAVPPNPAAQAAVPPVFRAPVPAIHVTGKGLHRLDLTLQLKLAREGGWRVARARLPAAPANALNLAVPLTGTEVLLGGLQDRGAYQTKAANERIQTALGPDGLLNLRWRPKVNEGEVDRALNAESSVLLDIEEDRLRLAWSLKLDFRRGEHDFFEARLPEGYLVEKVTGLNVRGWQIEGAAGGSAAAKDDAAKMDTSAGRRLRVTLLKRAEATEQFTIYLWRPGPVPAQEVEKIAMPVVGVPDALRHTGRLTIRRSPLLDVRTLAATGVRRDNVAGADEIARVASDAGESPLGLQAYQTYNFVAVPFDLQLELRVIQSRAIATVQTILRLAEHERMLESRINLNVQHRQEHRLRVRLPDDLDVEAVTTAGVYEWTLTKDAGHKLLTVYFAAGVQGTTPVVVRGRFNRIAKPTEAALPCLQVLDMAEQYTELVVQADPAFDVQSADLKDIEPVLMSHVTGWMKPAQRTFARLALSTRAPAYSGRLTLVPRQADVASHTVTNVRITDRAIEETVLIDFAIRNAGIRMVEFTLPAALADARISVPFLRQKTVEPVEGTDRVRVRLELQSEVMNQLRVLVQGDRLLGAGTHVITLPAVQTGRMDRRYLAIESAGRDEVLIRGTEGLEPLTRQQKEWSRVEALLKNGSTQAFMAPPAGEPQLTFETRQRATVETAGARIGLAQTLVLVDGDGAYRASQTYFMDNQTEQFLEIMLPEGAVLWTASVAGEYVKPVSAENDPTGRRVRIPLVKTAGGDLDYAIVLKYGGRLEDVRGLSRTSFPFIRTGNVNVELSQVELRLPNTHRWVHFDGTLRRIEEQGDFEADILSYQGKLAKRLSQSFQYGNPFEKARAAANLKGLHEAMTAWTGAGGKEEAGNARLNAERSKIDAFMTEVDQQLKQADTQTSVQVNYNGVLMNDAFLTQDNAFARNVVIQHDGNWDDTTVTGQTTGGAVVFNEGWLERNQLRMDATEAAADKPQAPGAQADVPAGDLLKDRMVSSRAGQARAMQSQSDVIFGQRKGEGAKAADGATAEKELDARQQVRSQEQRAETYQRKLAQREIQNAPKQQLAQADWEIEKLERRPAGTTGPAAAGERQEEDAEARPATGLASLDVDFPAMDPARWTSYRFTTPRGEVGLRGYAVTQTAMQAWARVGLALIVLMLAVMARRLRLLRPGEGLYSRRGGRLLIVLGCIGLLGGILPLAAFLALLTGIVFRIIHRGRTA